MEKTKSGNTPIKKFKAGAISATIWENQAQNKQGEEVTYSSVSFERNYKDANGELFKTRLQHMLLDTLALNPIPDAVKTPSSNCHL